MKNKALPVTDTEVLYLCYSLYLSIELSVGIKAVSKALFASNNASLIIFPSFFYIR
ncbi:hypothetical protein [Clostridium sp. DJ247]|uniref:hypothetical protein n=1 Tax=Clostridium sp. DJ247 TaxID=2726188 RepID=UPI00162735F1|nr:hypothetical protein [Clostridium sp. DJ247]MBC2578780.1 hypothetical protein [Clostridium sp. DJ247]